MNKKAQIINLIQEALEDIKDIIGETINTNNPETKLFGQDSAIDSMAMVALVISFEGKINSKFDSSIVLANEKAVSMKNSPFKTINSLADYAIELLEQNHE